VPAVVDHETRRTALAEVAADLIAKGGAEAATVRAVAAAAGVSTKAVTHYFSDKRALMLLTYRHAAMRSQARTEASQQMSRRDVAALLCALLPLDPAVERDWRVWFSFWGIAVADSEFTTEQSAQVRAFTEQIALCLAADPSCAGFDEGAQSSAASLVLAALLGIVAQAMFDPQEWPPERQIEAVNEALARLVGRAVVNGEE
jgi:AcrR family transcriptional regulator